MTDAPLAPTAVPAIDPTAAFDPIPPSAPAPAAPAAAPAVDQNPLDALEAILEQAKAGVAQPAESDPNAPAAADAAALAAAEEARKQAELEQLEAEKRVQDAAQLQEELAALKNVGQTSADQARVAQNEARQQDQVQRAEAKAEYSIHQLGHTKI